LKKSISVEAFDSRRVWRSKFKGLLHNERRINTVLNSSESKPLRPRVEICYDVDRDENCLAFLKLSSGEEETPIGHHNAIGRGRTSSHQDLGLLSKYRE